jgi:hypothetical protein
MGQNEIPGPRKTTRNTTFFGDEDRPREASRVDAARWLGRTGGQLFGSRGLVAVKKATLVSVTTS